MTINKSQGQTLNRVRIYLPQPVFSHGQLYVALSRVTSYQNIKVLINDNNNCHNVSGESEILSEIRIRNLGDISFAHNQNSEMSDKFRNCPKAKLNPNYPKISANIRSVRNYADHTDHMIYIFSN